MIVKHRHTTKHDDDSDSVSSIDAHHYQHETAFNPVVCQAVQWIFCVLCSAVLLSALAYILLTPVKPQSSYTITSNNYKHYALPQCPALLDDDSTVSVLLSDASKFKHLLHAPFIFTGDHDNKRKEFELRLKELWLQKTKMHLFAYEVHGLPTRRLDLPPTSAHDENAYDIHLELLFNKHRIKKLGPKQTNNLNSSSSGVVVAAVTHERSVSKTWNENAFNFHQVSIDSVLFAMDDNVLLSDDSQPLFQCYPGTQSIPTTTTLDTHLVLINKFPIGNFSGLFVPYFARKLTQTLTLQTSLQKGLQFAQMFASNEMKIGFNSMGAMASVNHLHFQFWHIHQLPVEVLAETLVREKAAVLHSNAEIVIREMVGYAVHALIYAARKDGSNWNVGHVLRPLFHCISHLIERNIPHNLLITRARVFLFVRREEQSSQYPIFYGFSDVSGWITVLDEEKYNTLTMREIWDDMRDKVSIQNEKWQSVKQHCSNF